MPPGLMLKVPPSLSLPPPPPPAPVTHEDSPLIQAILEYVNQR